MKLYNKLSFHDRYKEKPALKEELNFSRMDAHNYGYRWPLNDEIAFMTSQHSSMIINVDDIKILHLPQFQYMTDNGQVSDRQYIVNALSKDKTYTDHTSPSHHPLIGVRFVIFGESIQIPNLTNFYEEKIER